MPTVPVVFFQSAMTSATAGSSGLTGLTRANLSGWARCTETVNHAHLVAEGIAGFVQAIDMSRVEEVRLADCFRNGHEVHLKPARRQTVCNIARDLAGARDSLDVHLLQ